MKIQLLIIINSESLIVIKTRSLYNTFLLMNDDCIIEKKNIIRVVKFLD